MANLTQAGGPLSDKEINAALGAEVRLAREKLGLTRPELVELLPFACTELVESASSGEIK